MLLIGDGMIWKGWKRRSDLEEGQTGSDAAGAPLPPAVGPEPDVAAMAPPAMAGLPPEPAMRPVARPAFFDSLFREDVRPGDDLPRFLANASDDVEDGEGAELARRQLALRDALGASQPVIAREGFAGRHDAMRMLINAVEQQRVHVVIYGERGIGKTSLSHVFAETARQARYLVIYVSCSTESQFAELFRAVSRRIPRIFHSSVLPNSPEAEKGDNFDMMLPEVFGPRELADLLAGVVGTRVLIVLDEYDRVADSAFRRDVAELIKNLSDRAARVQLVLTGVAQNLDELIGFAPSIRRNIIGLPMRPLEGAEVADVLRLGERAAGLRFADDAISMIEAVAGGSPYLVRLLGHQAGMVALNSRKPVVTGPDCSHAIEQVLADWTESLPRRVQASLARDDARNAWPLLVSAARAGSTADGWFNTEDLLAAMGADPSAAPAVTRELERFTEPGGLVERYNDGNGGFRYRFGFPGVSALLLMSAAMSQLQTG